MGVEVARLRRATSDKPCRGARGHAWEASVVKIVDQSRVACVFPIKHLCKTNQPRESTYYYGCANREATEPYRHKQGTRLPLISCVSTIISRTQSSLSLSLIPSTLPYSLPCLPYLNKVRCHTNPSHTDMKRAMHCLNPE